jgi:hypothetical protein
MSKSDILAWLGRLVLLVVFGYFVRFLLTFVPDSATWPLIILSLVFGAIGFHSAKRQSTSLHLNRRD